MSRWVQTLPWCLLAVSLAAHLWPQRREAAAVARAEDRTYETHRTHETYKSHETGPSAAATPTVIAVPAQLVAPSQPAAPASPAATFAAYAAYADLLAGSLETPGQHDDLARVLSRWVAVDPAGASEWLNRRPDDPRFDLPVAQVATHLVAEGDYGRAREWAESIRTPAVRLMAIEEVLAEQYRAGRLTATQLAARAHDDGLPADRLRAILDYSRLD